MRGGPARGRPRGRGVTGEQGAVVDHPGAPVGQPPAELLAGRVVVREVDRHHVGVLDHRAGPAEPAYLLGEGGQVQVVGAVVGLVAEGLLHQHHVVGRVPHRLDGGVGQRPGVGGVEQAAPAGADVEEHGAVAVAGLEDADVVAADAQPVPGGDLDEADRGVGGEPHPGLLDDRRRPDHVERLVVGGDPGAEQQERRGAVVGVGVRDQHVPEPGEVDPGPLRRVRGLGAAVEQQDVVDEGGGLAASPPARPLAPCTRSRCRTGWASRRPSPVPSSRTRTPSRPVARRRRGRRTPPAARLAAGRAAARSRPGRPPAARAPSGRGPTAARW